MNSLGTALPSQSVETPRSSEEREHRFLNPPDCSGLGSLIFLMGVVTTISEGHEGSGKGLVGTHFREVTHQIGSHPPTLPPAHPCS